MDLGSRRGKTTTTRTSVVAGSVWESRMKIDEVKGGIKVFNGEEDAPEETCDASSNAKPRPKQQGGAGKRKTWKSESPDGSEKSPIQIARRRSEGKSRELSVCADPVRKSPSRATKPRPEIASVRSPIQKMKTRSDEAKENSVQLRKAGSESDKVSSECESSDDKYSIPLTTIKSMPGGVLLGESGGENEGSDRKKKAVESEKMGCDEACGEFDVCEDKAVSSSVSNEGQAKSDPEKAVIEDVDDDEDDEEEEEEDWEELEEEVEKEIQVQVEIEKKSVDVKEIKMQETKSKQVVNGVKKIHEKTTIPISPIVKKQPPPVYKPRIHTYPTKTTPSPVETEFRRRPETHNKLQSFVDLIMWSDISKSAFIFGVGTFLTISSSYTTDLNISFITVVSYLSLVYLTLIFLYRSIICRLSKCVKMQ